MQNQSKHSEHSVLRNIAYFRSNVYIISLHFVVTDSLLACHSYQFESNSSEKP